MPGSTNLQWFQLCAAAIREFYGSLLILFTLGHHSSALPEGQPGASTAPPVMRHTRCAEHWAAKMGPAPLCTPQKSSKPPHFHRCLPCPGKLIQNQFIPDLFYQGSGATSHFQRGRSKKPRSTDTKRLQTPRSPSSDTSIPPELPRG